MNYHEPSTWLLVLEKIMALGALICVSAIFLAFTILMVVGCYVGVVNMLTKVAQ